MSLTSKGAKAKKKIVVGEKKNNYWMIPGDVLKEKYG